MAIIAIVDDHALVRRAFALLVTSLGHVVLSDYNNGKELIDSLNIESLPDIALLDIHMPIMDGFKTSELLRQKFPHIKVLALSMYDNEDTILKMFQKGAKGFVKKHADSSELKKAIDVIMEGNIFYSESKKKKISNEDLDFLEGQIQKNLTNINLTEKEIEFLKLTCSEMTYKEIACKMKISPRTVDDYRDHLFDKLNVKSRVGLVLFAIREQLVLL